MTAVQKNPCIACGLKDLCMARDLSAKDTEVFEKYLRQSRTLEAGSSLFWQGDAFHGLYAVRSGAVKTVARDAQGRERVRGFYLPGDVIGLDALYSQAYPASAETLGEARVCVIPHNSMGKLLADLPAFSQRLLRLLSRELCQSLSLAGEYSADQRMAAFLLDLADRAAWHSGDDSQLSFEMSRTDIANYLRLVPETVSRVLGRFSKKSWVTVQRRYLQIHDRAALEALAAPLREALPSADEDPYWVRAVA